MTRTILGLLTSCFVLGCGSDPMWTGDFVGTATTQVFDCAGETARPLERGSLVIPVTEDLDGIILGLACDVRLRQTSPTSAELVPSDCMVTDSAGRPASISYEDGAAELDGDSLGFSIEARIVSESGCALEFVTFVGSR